MENDAHSDFDVFKDAWLESILEGAPSPTEKGRRFCEKLVAAMLDLEADTLDAIYCDGTGDGGIDAAVLERAERGPEGPIEGDVWHLVQSKFGAAFSGENTLIHEGRKVIDTLAGDWPHLSSLASGLLEKLKTFRNGASESDRINLTFATIDPLTERERRALDDMRTLGRERIGGIFDVTAYSVYDVHRSLLEEEAAAAKRRLTVPLTGHMTTAGEELLVGSVKLLDLHAFMAAYRSRTGNLDQLYEKNVRRFLGGRVKVNKGMQRTLLEAPERFGLYNNGVTIVVSDYKVRGTGAYELTEPYIVNGCQSTKTIWEIVDRFVASGGTGKNSDAEAWKTRAESGCVVVKIAKVGADGEQLLQDITRYTNSQNAVRDKDFIALDAGFKSWAAAMGREYDVFLETQRGGWDSQRAFERQNIGTKRYFANANALDLMKVYGAGWKARPGLAFGKNPPFLPGGTVFEQIIVRNANEPPFGAKDLYAALLLQQAASVQKFGRGGPPARRQSKFIFYFSVIALLKHALVLAVRPHGDADVSDAIVKLLRDPGTDGGSALIDAAAGLIDSYMTEADDNCILQEPALRGQFNFDMNGFLKWDKIGNSLDATPILNVAISVQHQFIGMRQGGNPSVRDRILSSLIA